MCDEVLALEKASLSIFVGTCEAISSVCLCEVNMNSVPDKRS